MMFLKVYVRLEKEWLNIIINEETDKNALKQAQSPQRHALHIVEWNLSFNNWNIYYISSLQNGITKDLSNYVVPIKMVKGILRYFIKLPNVRFWG